MRFAFDARPDDDGERDDLRDRMMTNVAGLEYGAAMAQPVGATDYTAGALATLARIDARDDAEREVFDPGASWERRGAPHRHASRYRDHFIDEYIRAHRAKEEECRPKTK